MGISNRGIHRLERPGPSDIWRTWLVTGGRTHPIDRRRMQGEHRGLKRMLAEGGESGIQRRPWTNFSRAMVRQSVNEAMGRLPSEERVVISLAYCVGFSNQEIAEELGMTARGVQRILRRALDHLSDVMERGKRAALALLVILSGERVSQLAGSLCSPVATQVAAVVLVVGGLAAAPALDDTAAAPAAKIVQVAAWQAPPVQPAQPPAPPASTVPAAVPDVTVPGVPAIQTPTVPALKVPVTIPKLRIKMPLPRKGL